MKTAQAVVRCLTLSQAVVVVGLGLSLSSPAWATDNNALHSNALHSNALHSKALELALAGESKSALVILKDLEKQKMPEAQMAQVELSAGRVMYQTGDYKGAIAEYRKIGSGTDAWFSALEERSWAYMQLNQPDDALAQLKTLLSPLFKDKASSEAYFLSSLAHLRVCDYPALFKDLDMFKTRFRDRVKTMKRLASTDATAAAQLKEVSDSIQKMNIVEAEAIQRLYMDENLKKSQDTPPKIMKHADDLSFAVDGNDEKEVWMDEVDNYQVRVSGCPKMDTPKQARTGGGHSL